MDNNQVLWKILPDTSYSYRVSEPLGTGTYGTVYLGLDKNTEDFIAVKLVDKDFIEKYNKTIQLEREIDFFCRKDIKHENIINCLNAYEDELSYYLITEYCEGGNLYNYLMKRKEITESEVIDIMAEILNGYAYLRKLGYVHRDLKTENILIKNGKYKICDFGGIRSTLQGLLVSAAPGTQAYMSPEMLSGIEVYDYKTDIWSLGIIFYELLYSRLPFKSKSPMILLEEIEKFGRDPNIIFTSEIPISPHTKKLLNQMLCVDKNQRISLTEIVKSNLFEVTFEEECGLKLKRNTKYNTEQICTEIRLNLPKITNNNNNNNNSNTEHASNNTLDENTNQPILIKNDSKPNDNDNTIQIYIVPKNQKTKQKIITTNADEKTIMHLKNLSEIIKHRNQGLNILSERLYFEKRCIDYTKKLIQKSNQFAKVNNLGIMKYYQLTFPLAKIACMKYAKIIRPMYEKKINTIGMPENIWDIIIQNKEFLKIIEIVRNSLMDQQVLYPRYYDMLNNYLKENPFNKPLNELDEKFNEIINYDFDQKDKVLNFLECILNLVKQFYQANNKLNDNNTRFGIIYLQEMENFVSILKSGKSDDILMFHMEI